MSAYNPLLYLVVLEQSRRDGALPPTKTHAGVCSPCPSMPLLRPSIDLERRFTCAFAAPLRCSSPRTPAGHNLDNTGNSAGAAYRRGSMRNRLWRPEAPKEEEKEDSRDKRQRAHVTLRALHSWMRRRGLYLAKSANKCGLVPLPNILPHWRFRIYEDGRTEVVHGRGVRTCGCGQCYRCLQDGRLKHARALFAWLLDAQTAGDGVYSETLTLPTSKDAAAMYGLLRAAYAVHRETCRSLEVVNGAGDLVEVEGRGLAVADWTARAEGGHGFHLHGLVRVSGGYLEGTRTHDKSGDKTIAERARKRASDDKRFYDLPLGEATPVEQYALERWYSWTEAVHKAAHESISATVRRVAGLLRQTHQDGLVLGKALNRAVQRRTATAPAPLEELPTGRRHLWRRDLPQLCSDGWVRGDGPGLEPLEDHHRLVTRHQLEADPVRFGLVQRRLPAFEGLDLELAEQAYDLQAVGTPAAAARYLAKAGLEVALLATKTDSKGHSKSRNVVQLGLDVADNERPEDVHQLQEYWRATQGKSLVVGDAAALAEMRGLEPVALPMDPEAGPPVTLEQTLEYPVWLHSVFQERWVVVEPGRTATAGIALEELVRRSEAGWSLLLAWLAFLDLEDRRLGHTHDRGRRRWAAVGLAIDAIREGTPPPGGLAPWVRYSMRLLETAI